MYLIWVSNTTIFLMCRIFAKTAGQTNCKIFVIVSRRFALKTIQHRNIAAHHFQLISYHFHHTGKLNLVRDCGTYNYLNQSGCTEVSTIDDKKDFLVVEVGIYVFTVRLTVC